jgi:ribonuclease-3
VTVKRRRTARQGGRPRAVPADDLAGLEAALGHKFRNRGVLLAALRHSSLGGSTVAADFDRLEFLGDRVIGLIVAELLLERYPKDDEGAIARRYAQLVNRDSLAGLARTIGLGRYLELSMGEARAGGGDNPGVLADAFEAVAAALYRDGGMKAARDSLAGHFAPLAAQLAVPPRDAKTALQEWAQARGLNLPIYRAVNVSGPAHRPRFSVEVKVEGFPPASADGPSKRAAEQEAAAALLATVS